MAGRAKFWAWGLEDEGLDEAAKRQAVAALAARFGREVPELEMVLYSPTVSVEDKRAIEDAVLAKIGGNKTLHNFVGLLLTKGRFDEYPGIVSEFSQMADAAAGRVRARVRSLSGSTWWASAAATSTASPARAGVARRGW